MVKFFISTVSSGDEGNSLHVRSEREAAEMFRAIAIMT